ncbi:MAG: Gluconate 2-dehydrogenase subunit 3 family protein [uncultured Segetibacter sp.]|uniref:Gluconate 2-dehydrogenase subunit 3 family protein n=1 Tax=uncultured Segetibacter sp. TaxID=481133 RepID=A0A6J4S5E1_9BACT|nr:MAG: Gluconate 2-dehydrogenase subunit 3 family protein [uncultured Segetibacter sp.]
MITRREAIRNCLIVTIGAFVPSCVQEKSKPAIAYKNLSINSHEEKLISEVSETIIPATDTPGAKDTYTHLFVLTMLDDCYTKDEQQQFIKGMKEFEKLSQKKFDKSFVNCNVLQREELVRSSINNKNVSEDVSAFFKIIKKLTVQGYMTSKYYLTDVQVYKLVPGKYFGCLPVTSLNQKGNSI